MVHHRRQPVSGSFHCRETRRFGGSAKRPVYGAGTHRKRNEGGGQKEWTDSPKYKALGNSIALPFWDWMLRRMARYLPEDATLGSLFDGIGGFPLIWERIHGKGAARWASEIEPFPIAVTKRWFGEE